MKINKRTIVYHKKTGEKWILYPTKDPHIIYLKNADGLVPNGQEINTSTAEELFSLLPIREKETPDIPTIV